MERNFCLRSSSKLFTLFLSRHPTCCLEFSFIYTRTFNFRSNCFKARHFCIYVRSKICFQAIISRQFFASRLSNESCLVSNNATPKGALHRFFCSYLPHPSCFVTHSLRDIRKTSSFLAI